MNTVIDMVLMTIAAILGFGGILVLREYLRIKKLQDDLEKHIAKWERKQKRKVNKNEINAKTSY